MKTYNINGTTVNINDDGEVFMNMEHLKLNDDDCIKHAQQILTYMRLEDIIPKELMDKLY